MATKRTVSIVAAAGYLLGSAAAQSAGFLAPQTISSTATIAQSVYATDLDGDGDADVLSSAWIANEIAWYENQGGGVFGAPQVITTAAMGANDVFATDLDGDGDADVLSASMAAGKID